MNKKRVFFFGLISFVTFFGVTVHSLSMRGYFSARGYMTVRPGAAPGGGGSPPGTVLAGNNAIETNETLVDPNRVYAYTSCYSASASGTLAAGHLYGRESSGANAKMLVYNSDGSSLLATSDGLGLSAGDAWNDFTFSGGNQISINSGTTYCIGVIADHYWYLKYEAGSFSTTEDADGSYATPPSVLTISGDNSSGGPHSMYITN